MSFWDISRKIYLVRHAQTEANVEGIVVGISDSPLTAKGEEQVAQLASKFASRDFDKIYSSPLKRTKILAHAIQTAKADPSIQIVEKPELIEIDFGDHEGMRYADIPRGPQLKEEEYYVRKVAPNGESRADLDARISGFVELLKQESGDCVVVTHGGPLRSIFTQMLELRLEDAWSFDVSNGSVFVLALIGKRWVLHALETCN